MIESWGKHKEWDGTGAVPYNNTFWIAAQHHAAMTDDRTIHALQPPKYNP